MKKLLVLAVAAVFSMGVAQVGYAVAQEKKVDEKMEKKGAKTVEKGEKMEKKGAKTVEKGEKMEKKGADMKAKGEKMKKDAANPCAAKADKK